METASVNNSGLCVIVPVYNGMKYLDDCVKSVLAQTRRVEQIILVDDGSTDGTAGRCDEYAAEYENIEVVHRPNGGLGFARNSGMEKCHCEYIGFVDVDDYPEPGMYEQMLEHIQKTGASVVCCDIKCITKYPPRDCSGIRETIHGTRSMSWCRISRGACMRARRWRRKS